MEEVIRWSTGENMKNNTGEKERERDRHTRASPVALHSTLHFKCSCRCTEQL